MDILRIHPTSPFTILEPQNPWIDEFYVVQERRTTDFKALKLRKGSSGNRPFHIFRPQNLSIDVSVQHKIRGSKIVTGSVG